jgi:hypothetical protein
LGVLALALALAAMVAACSGGAEKRTDDASVAPEAGSDGSSSNDHPVDQATSQMPIGGTCALDEDCLSGHCAEGVCCNSACADACYTCAASGSVGTCVAAEVGSNPRGACKDDGAASCGYTGQCDGAGACQKYSLGTICQQPGCTSAMLMTAGRCDGTGTCTGAASTTCAPFQCDTNGQCRTTCASDEDCIAPNTCNSQGSCGKKPVGATCGNDVECNSGSCAQGVCCSTACAGTCKSCALPSSAGTCTNVPANQDPLMQCTDEGAMTCGGDGTCDGMGACHKYNSGTVCGTDSCTAGVGTLAGRCGTNATCLAGTQVSCSPYVCGATACLTKCATNTDCATGYVCTNTICTKKPNGATCAAGSECTSGQCYQGVCCNVACGGTCQACNLTATMGTCTSIAAGMPPTPASQCVASDKSTCGNDGFCDGRGACRQWSAGTTCATATCTGSTLTSARTCDGSGLCRPASTSMCDPFLCATNNSCRIDCATSADCATPNICMNNSCGKLPPGASCIMASQCNSGFCEQGVCCNTACQGTCKSCAAYGSAGTCANVPSGQLPTPASQCVDGGASTCGSDGTCDGNGACRKYVSGTVCAGASCSGTTYSAPRTCTGTGTCSAATTSSCNEYQCDTTNKVCKTTCTADADCATSYFCINNLCTKKPLGNTCAAAGECNSGFCQQGVCCASACTGTCMSCSLTGSLGTCSQIPAGVAPTVAAQCATTNPSTCGTNGLCDGKGACQLFASGTVCSAETCSGSTHTPARTCDGAGVCKTVTSNPCDPYLCDTTNKICKTTCTTTATDCLAPNQCVNNACGSKPDGSTCAAASECQHGFCQQGVCCGTACTGTCNSCAVTGKLGTCSAVPAGGADPTTTCKMVAASTCGQTGFCDGAGGCQKYASGTQCLAATCTGSTLTSSATCNGSGTCSTPTTSSCSPYNCGTGACKTTCTSNADCINSNYVCTGTACTPATNLQVKLYAGTVGANAWISPHFQIVNNSASGMPAVPLSELTVRYWYTNDTAAASSMPNCDYAQLTCANISYGASSFVVVSPARTKADRYFQFGFTTGAGSLAANGASTGEIQLRWAKTDFSSYDQASDYSYNGSTSYAVTTNVTVYRNGTLIYGTEPM